MTLRSCPFDYSSFFYDRRVAVLGDTRFNRRFAMTGYAADYWQM